MPIVETHALVLETREYRETSMLATLLTPDRGRLGAVAKGARKGKTAVAPILQPFSLLSVRLSVREGGRGGLANLVSADLLERPAYARPGGMAAGRDAQTGGAPAQKATRGTETLARLAYAGLFAEVLASTQENDPHSESLFALARALFSGLAEAPHPGSFAVHGAFALLESLGYAPDLESHPDEDFGTKGKWVLDLLNGTLHPSSARNGAEWPGLSAAVATANSFPLSAESVRALREVVESLRAQDIPSPGECATLNRRIGPDLMRLAIRMLETHLERRLRSARYLEEMVLAER